MQSDVLTPAADAPPLPRELAGPRIPPINWNGVPFQALLPPSRRSVITRFAPSVDIMHIGTAIPIELIQRREHRIELISETISLFLITNAPEAATDLPEAIQTAYRATGTFYEASATWRGQTERAFISASVTDARVAAAIKLARTAPHRGNSLATYVALMRDVLRTGIIMESLEFTKGLTEDELILANLLLKHDNIQLGTVYSYDVIGSALGINGETVRQRHIKLSTKAPILGRIIASVRPKNAKGANTPSLATSDPDATDED